MYTSIVKTGNIVTFSATNKSLSIVDSILKGAKIEKSGGSVIITFNEETGFKPITLTVANVTTPVVTTADELITALLAMYGTTSVYTVTIPEPFISGTVSNSNVDPTDKAALAANIVAGNILTGTPTGNILYTLPTGTQMDTANAGLIAIAKGVNFNVINLSANTITMTAGTAFTIVGAAIVLANTSATFRAVKTATNTFILYRL